MQIALIGIGAGAAAGLLFASVTSGSWLAVFLFYLSPLPLLIAALGWSHWAAMIGALVAAAALGAIFGPLYLAIFLAVAGLPAWWLSYLAMLARPVANGGETHLEWYPPGRLVVWAALLGALIVIAAIPTFGLDGESFRAGLRGSLNHMLRIETGEPAHVPGVNNSARLLDFLVSALPAAAAILATITNLINLWMAASIVKYSGLLKRPWPALPAMTFPRILTGVLALAMILSFLGGLLGIVAGVLSASLLMAYGVLGFAVLHTLTQGMDARMFLLGGIYASVLVFGWPVLGLCLLGVIDAGLDLRARFARKRGPPTPT
jgi:hypothetical protein